MKYVCISNDTYMGLSDLIGLEKNESQTIESIILKEKVIEDIYATEFIKKNRERVVPKPEHVLKREIVAQQDYFVGLIEADLYNKYRKAIASKDKTTIKEFFKYFNETAHISAREVLALQEGLDTTVDKPRFQEQYNSYAESMQKILNTYLNLFTNDNEFASKVRLRVKK